MISDQELHRDLEDRVARFGKTNPLVSLDGTKSMGSQLDTIRLLSVFDRTQQNLYLCSRQDPCKCKSSTHCNCDSDAYTHVTSIKSDILSNCKYIIELTLAQSSVLDRKSKAYRLFSLNDEEEEDLPIADISVANSQMIIYSQAGTRSVTFPLTEKPVIKYGILTLQFDYLIYS